MKFASCWFEPVQVGVRSAADDANPDIATRVFVQSKRLVATETILWRIDSYWSRSRKLIQRVRRRKLEEPGRCRHPPLVQVILNKQLVPTPRGNNTGRQVNAEIFEAPSIEAMNVILVSLERAGNYKEFAFTIFT